MNRHPFTLHFGYKIQRAPAFCRGFLRQIFDTFTTASHRNFFILPTNYRSFASQASREPTPSSRLRLYRPHSNDASNRPSRLQLTIAYNSARGLFRSTRLRYNLKGCNSANLSENITAALRNVSLKRPTQVLRKHWRASRDKMNLEKRHRVWSEKEQKRPETKYSCIDTSQVAGNFTSPETKKNKSFKSVKEGTLSDDSEIR